jgi:hypothetical protein
METAAFLAMVAATMIWWQWRFGIGWHIRRRRARRQ